jgi:hypothetical protein
MVGVAAQVPIATRERSVPVSQGCTGPTAVSLAACVAALLCAQPTSAYRTAGDLPEFADTETVAWVDGVVRYELNERLPQGLALEAVETAVLGAFHSWSEPACSGLLVHYSGLVSDDAAPGDGRNTVQWVYSGWADLGFAQDAPGATDIQYETTGGPSSRQTSISMRRPSVGVREPVGARGPKTCPGVGKSPPWLRTRLGTSSGFCTRVSSAGPTARQPAKTPQTTRAPRCIQSTAQTRSTCPLTTLMQSASCTLLPPPAR